MNKNFSRIVALLTAILIVLAAVPTGFAAVSEKCGDNLVWSLKDGVLSIDGSGDMNDYAVSYTPWFDCRADIESVSISDGVTSVGSNAFYDCDSLEAVELPAGITEIGSGAFRDCGMLEEITVPDGTISIGDGAFYASALKNAVVPASVTYIGKEAFGWCFELEKITVAQGNKNYSSDAYGVLFDADKTMLISFPAANSQTSYIIPGTVDNIEDFAFANSINLENVTVPASVASMGENAFFNSSIKSFDVEGANAVYSSENGVLFNKNKTVLIQYPACNDAETYTVPSGVEEIAASAFHNSLNLKGVVISEGIETLGDEIFYWCDNLEYVHIPSSVTEIGADIVDNTNAYICADSENSYAKTYADENGFEFGICSGHAVKGVVISENEIEIENKKSYTLTATVTPETATDKAVVWTSDNEDIATVEGGVVTAVSPGTTTVTASAGYKTASCKVTVTPRVFKITWIVDGVETVENVAEGDKISAPADPEKEGCSFAFWSPDVPDTMPERDLKFTAVWTAEGYKTVFDANGGKWADGAKTKNLYFLYGEKIVVPEVPERTGYDFVEWTPVIPDAMPAETLNFEAVWSANNYDAVFDANGGKWADGDTVKTVSTAYDSQINAPANPERAGYTFVGWSPEVGVMDSIEGKSYTARWVAMTNIVYTVETYKMNTEGGYDVEIEEHKGTTDTEVTVGYDVTEGFVFNTEKSVLSGIVAADGSLVLKVYYDRVKNTVTINGVTAEYYYGASIAEPAKPEAPEGYEQQGWVDGDGNPVVFPIEVNNGVPSQIKPDFVKRVYTVKWNVDGSVTEENYEFEAVIAKPADPEKEGYIFKGWTPEIPDNMPAYDLEFTAAFEKIIYTCECGERFDDEAAFNAHVAYENALKATRISIKNNPGTKKINYGETLRLTAVLATDIADVNVYWFVDGENAGEGETFEISFKSGEKTVTAKAVDANGNVLLDASGNEISDEQKVTVNSGIWQKIVSFFKNLFRMNRTVIQMLFNA